jgi:diguanylate cyclase (GGDEF)-like protein/PAS domain S-box-containing protein
MDDLSTGSGVASFHDPSRDFHYLAYPSHTLVWLCDRCGQCDFVSPSWPIFTGREIGHELGSGWLDRVHPEDLAVLTRALADAIEEKQPFRLLYRYLRADGVYRWFVNQGMVRTTHGEGFTGYVGQCFDVTAYQEGEAELEWSAQRMITLLKQTRLIALVADQEGRVLFSNGSLCRLLHQGGNELINARLFQRHLAPGSETLLNRLYPDGAQIAQFPSEFESALLTSQGETRHVMWHSISLHEYSGHAKSTILIGDDITASRREELRLKLSASVVEFTSHAVLITDVDLRIIAINRAFSELTGYSKEDALGRHPRILKSGRHDKGFYVQMWKSIAETGHWRGDVWDRRKDGGIYPKFLSISAIKDAAGEITHYAGIFYEVTERKAIEERLDLLAHYDTLTGLPNRCLLFDRLEQAVDRSTRNGTKIGLLYLDLDHFKQVNDTFGHSAGDSLLQAVAQRLKACVRTVDTVARLGGDEFVVLLPDIKTKNACARVAQKILDAMRPIYDLGGRSVTTMSSIGISIYPDDHGGAEALLRNADAAMYAAKQGQRGNFKFFSDTANAARIEP